MNTHPTRPPILVVEPDRSLRTSITYQIRQEGYVVLALGNAALAREVVRENPLALLVFDPSALTSEELALCQEIRANPLTKHLPILLLLTREREITQIEQMGLGVTDYLLKPLLWDELRACVRALMRGCQQGKPHRQARSPSLARRTSLLVTESTLTIGELSIDLERHRVSWHHREVDLKRPFLFDLLVYLAQHRDVVLTRTQLLAQVWGYTAPDDLAGDTHTVSVHIRLPTSAPGRGPGASSTDPNRAWDRLPFPGRSVGKRPR